jgi:DNA-binding NarL/FixJ family response regulator
MKIHVIENYSMCTQHLIEGLNEATGCRIYHSSNLEEGLQRLEELRPDVILLSLDQRHHHNASCGVRKIQGSADAVLARWPVIILLGSSYPNVAEAASCRDLGAIFMLRHPEQPIYYEARVALWLRNAKKFIWTIRFERHSGTWSMHICSGMCSRQIIVPTQPMRLALLLASGREAYTVEEIADELRICRQSVKKYISDLNRAAVLAVRDLNESMERIFWMDRRPGGTLCGLKANIIRV